MRRVVIPFYGDDPIRQANYDAVVRHLWAGGFDEQTLRAGGASMAEARNNGLRALTGGGVVVFNDADSLVPTGAIERACELALEAPGVVFAYTLYLRLTFDGRRMYLEGERDLFRLPVEQQIFGAPSIGCVAVAVQDCPPFDEGFVGWGYEDLEWLDRCSRELGPHRRIDGALWHLWHGARNLDDSPVDASPSAVRANLDRWLAARDAE